MHTQVEGKPKVYLQLFFADLVQVAFVASLVCNYNLLKFRHYSVSMFRVRIDGMCEN